MVTYGAMAREPITLGNALFIYKNLALTGFNRTRWVGEQSRAVIVAALKIFLNYVRMRFVKFLLQLDFI